MTTMNRHKASSLVVAAVVVLAVIVILLPPFRTPPGNGDQDGTTPLSPHPFNNLNWWDIASELGTKGSLLTTLQVISGYGPRYDGDPGYYLAGDWMIDLLSSMGITMTYYGNHDSVLGHQPGYGNDSRAIVFGAHLDSSSESIGVHQNLGGCAVVASIASILSRFRLPIDVYYCFFAGNMEFLDDQQRNRAMWGSREISAHLVEEGVDVVAFYNFDELLFRNLAQSETQRLVAEYRTAVLFGYQSTAYLADLLVTFMKLSGLDIISAIEETGTQTDHWSFWGQWIPAVNVKSGHTPNPEDPFVDSLNNPHFNTTQAFLVARAAASVAVYLSMQGNGQRSAQKLQGTIGPGEELTLRAVMTVPQMLSMRGVCSENSSLSIRVFNRTTFLLGSTAIPIGNFTITCELPAEMGPVDVRVVNQGNSSASIRLYLDYDSDTDGNGVLDSSQNTWPNPDPPLDWDGDGLSDADETVHGTDIFKPDTDSDMMSDSVEVKYGLDPLRNDADEDPDADGLTSFREIALGTHPVNRDTDSDGIPDGWEVDYGTNPLVNDAALDPDNDTLTNIEEYEHGADPLSADGDNDGVSDTIEVSLGMNPMNPDSDSDGLRDQLELLEGSNPLVPDYDADVLWDGPDPNPRINLLLVIGLIIILPVGVGSFLFWRRIR